MAKTLSRSAVLARELLGMIARRELLPGDPIDLQALGRRHGVSRTVVREALADLGGKGLVVARPKVGTAVAPAAQWNLLDPGLVAVAAAETGPASMMAEAIELRRVIEPALAADAALSASPIQRTAVLDAVRSIAGAVGRIDPVAAAAGEIALHDAIAAACANRLLQSIDRSLAPVRALHRERLHAAQFRRAGVGTAALRLLALHTELALAIVRRDGPAAAGAALAVASAARLEPGAALPARLPAGSATDLGIGPGICITGVEPPPVPAVVAAAVRPGTGDAGGASHRPAVIVDTGGASDWPDTMMLVRGPGAIAPARRARLDPDEAQITPQGTRQGGPAGSVPSFADAR
jgi:GntR family transcriptional regulator, galactonate operon transcriptional repressor